MNNTNECVICLHRITTSFLAHEDTNGALHPFHKNCLMKYIKGKRTAKCPICKVNLTSNNMNRINRPNTKVNGSNRNNGVNINITNNTNNSNTIKKINRNNLGLNRHQFLSYQPQMRAYFIFDSNTNSMVMNNDGSATMVTQNDYMFIDGLTNRTYISYDPDENTHVILPSHFDTSFLRNWTQ